MIRTIAGIGRVVEDGAAKTRRWQYNQFPSLLVDRKDLDTYMRKLWLPRLQTVRLQVGLLQVDNIVFWIEWG